MSRPAVPPPVDPAAALARHAARAPQQPFLFFRDPRGHFAWWAWERARAALAGGDTTALAPGEALAGDFLAAVAALPAAARASAAALLAALGEGSERDVWLTRGALDTPGEAALALTALAGGWAIVHDPGGELHPAVFLWARPTIVGGTADELARLCDGCERQAPRWRRRAWLTRRLRRLRAVVEIAAGDGSTTAARFAALGARPRWLSIPPDGW